MAKILLITLTTIFLFSCSTVKKVPDGDYLLEKNQIFVDSVKIDDLKVENLLYQKPNDRLLGIPLKLHIYNVSRVNQDSLYQDWLQRKPNRKKNMARFFSKKQTDRLGVAISGINEWIKKTGEAPSIVEELKAKRSAKRLQSYYWNNGWFNNKVDYEITKKDHKKAIANYYITPGKPYFIDSVKIKIQSPAADSIYRAASKNSTIISGKQYKTLNIEAERERVTKLYRNSGLYNFEKEFIKFDADTVNTDSKVNLNLLIQDRSISYGDSIARIPFKVHKVSKVNIFTDYSYLNKDKKPTDSTLYKGYNIYGYNEIEYTRRAITNSILITPGKIFKESDRTLTNNQINNLRTFKYPNITYDIDKNDASGQSLIANIRLTPRKKYSTSVEFDVTTSQIQAFGIGFGGSLLVRNVFGGAEILEISARGSIGSSIDAVDGGERFFNISEVGTDVKLSFPKIAFPLKTNTIIPKRMSPITNLIFGINIQKNIGLDRQNASGIFNYQWKPNKNLTNQIDVLNVQYVRNLNTNNYFNIYETSYEQLNTIARSVLDPTSVFFDQPNGASPSIQQALLTIPSGSESFIIQSLGLNPNPDLTEGQLRDIRNINERKVRLTEDNLIFASSYTFTKNNQENLFDETYSRFRSKIELAGNTLNAISKVAGLKENERERLEVFGVEYSQYAKLELDYIKHWGVGRNSVIAFRAFGGIALPFGNANSIPFARSFFAGGPNDNRAWSAYDLGPGSTLGRNEFNEANLKIAFNAEYRYGILGSLKGALFIDAGNIWNVLDNVEEEEAVFSKVSDLQEMAVGSGFGFRYDFDFFVLRLDLGFKTFNPANDEDQRWFKGYKFSEAVFNFGINYPF